MVFLRLIIIFLFSHSSILSGQEGKATLQLLDEKTMLPLAYATIIVNYPSEQYKVSDLNGYFEIEDLRKIHNIRISYVGYETKIFYPPFDNNNTVKLIRSSTPIDEIVITPDYIEKTVIRKVIKNRDKNNYLNQNFEAEVYCKTTMNTINSKITLKNNSLKHLFINENVNTLINNAKGGTRESVETSEAPGFNFPVLSMLISEIMPLSFYQDQILLFDYYYTNPISKNGLDEYHYSLESTNIEHQDTVFLIS
ncbi:MAG: carboxypeptidase-like regulatory domain-containing protein [Saprospiraceae bacterium]|nr:carboxypeptidase-like regulatory domain-containing protein [Saprospiraceae bacterium]